MDYYYKKYESENNYNNHYMNGNNYYYKKRDEPDEINPYEILGVSPLSSVEDCRVAYMKLANCPLRAIRRNASLAYDMVCNKDKYFKIGNKYKPKKKDCFYYTVVGDLDSLKYEIEKNKNLLFVKDSLGRSLLYLAARNGYFNLTEYLLKKGSYLNDI